MAHLEEHGFRSKKSTETNFLTFIHELSQNIDRKKQTDICKLDFSNAFDKVPHRRLPLKLNHYAEIP